MKLNLKQISLLDASGELSPDQRQHLQDHLSYSPKAQQQHESTQNAFSLLGLLPIPEPSAAERQRIPATLKRAIAAAIARPVKRARRTRLLIRYAVAAALLLLLSLGTWMWAGNAAQSRRELDQIARIHAAADRMIADQKPTSYDLAVTDVEASIRQLQTESPALSHVYDKNLSNLLDALADLPAADEDSANWPTWEPN